MLREEILLVYDVECPACNAYCQIVRIKQSVGDLRIVDARENSEVMNEITAQGLDIKAPKLDTQSNKAPNLNVINKHKLLGISSLFMF